MPPPPHGQGRREPVIERSVLEDLIFSRAPMRRYTQDCPILPDVWFEYGRNPLAQVDLLLTPRRGITPGQPQQDRSPAPRVGRLPAQGRGEDRAGGTGRSGCLSRPFCLQLVEHRAVGESQ